MDPAQVSSPYRQFLRPTLSIACIIVLGLAALATYDYFDSRSRPHETAKVIAVASTGLPCGNNGRGSIATEPGYTVEWRSLNPPRGLPATFYQQDVCKHYAVGHSETVVRRREFGADTRIEVSPFDSAKDEFIFVGIGALIAVPVSFLLALALRIWHLWRTGSDPVAP